MDPSISIKDLQTDSPPSVIKKPTITSRIRRRVSTFFLSLPSTTYRKKVFLVSLFFSLIFLREAYFLHKKLSTISSQAPSSRWLLKNTCTETLHSSQCFSTLSGVPATGKSTTAERLLKTLTITADSLEKSKTHILDLLNSQDLVRQQKDPLIFCMEMIEKTLDKLRVARRDLHETNIHSFFKAETICRRYGHLDLLLSIAVTDQENCLRLFHYDSDHDDGSKGQTHLANFIKDLKIPIFRMVSSSLAMIRDMEKGCWENVHSQERKINKVVLDMASELKERNGSFSLQGKMVQEQSDYVHWEF